MFGDILMAMMLRVVALSAQHTSASTGHKHFPAVRPRGVASKYSTEARRGLRAESCTDGPRSQAGGVHLCGKAKNLSTRMFCKTLGEADLNLPGRPVTVLPLLGASRPALASRWEGMYGRLQERGFERVLADGGDLARDVPPSCPPTCWGRVRVCVISDFQPRDPHMHDIELESDQTVAASLISIRVCKR